jgi:hypothetical protein
MCVANKMINGKQCTITWYVDDNKISHADQNVVDDVIQTIEERVPGLVVSKGDEHTFLGIDIKYLRDENKERTGQVSISMSDYIKEAAESFGEDLSKNVSSPGARWLFENSDARKLSAEKSDKFMSIVAKLLWVVQRGRPDCSTVISYLCTRTRSPDVEDWKKLKRLLSYLMQTIDDVRIIGADSLHEMQTFIDSSHAVHNDMRGHTGGVVTFGTGIVNSKSSKQKMNSRSSNETEVIGNSEYLPWVIWYEYFMEAQGYPITSNVVWQDNEGAEKMAKNGKLSCSSKSRHINIKFFWIADRVKQGKMTIKHCPTDIMLADFFTKPLQGKKFNMFREVIMGWEPVESLWSKIGPDNKLMTEGIASKERVENEEDTVKNEPLKVREVLAAKPNRRSVTWAEVVSTGRREIMMTERLSNDRKTLQPNKDIIISMNPI